MDLLKLPPEVKHMGEPLVLDIYTYKARLSPSLRHPTGVVDGDTIQVDVDKGMRDWKRGARMRLYAINAAEVRGSERPLGLSAKSHLTSLLETCPGFPHCELIVKTHKDKKTFDRYVAEIWTRDGEACLNLVMVIDGFAEWDLENL